MGDKKILAYFKSRTKAQKAVSELKKLGIVDLRTEILQNSPQNGSENIPSSLIGQLEGSPDSTIGLFSTGPDFRAYMGADFATGDAIKDTAGAPKDHEVILTVAVDNNRQYQALDILRKTGGIF